MRFSKIEVRAEADSIADNNSFFIAFGSFFSTWPEKMCISCPMWLAYGVVRSNFS
jgi:hypothetical protein